MRAINYKEMRRRYELDGPKKTVRHLSEAIREKHLTPEDFSIRELAEALIANRGGEVIGQQVVREWDPRRNSGLRLAEAGDGLDLTAFSNITGQLLISKILDHYTQVANVLSPIIPVIPTRMDGEKIPGVDGLKESAISEVKPGMPFPYANDSAENYVETPSTTKRGLIVPVTKEAVFFDRTNLILARAGEVGEILGLNKEKRLIDMAIGVTNNYKWKGTTYDTYSLNGTAGAASGAAWGGINQLGSNELVDWTDVDAAEQLFVNLTDPHTGEPIFIEPSHVLYDPSYKQAAIRIFGGGQLKYGADSATQQVVYDNPFGNKYTQISSALVRARLVASGLTAAQAKQVWLLGDFAKAFAYMENWPITVVQAPQNSDAEFEQDIIARYKASERGAAAVMDPRFIVKCTG